MRKILFLSILMSFTTTIIVAQNYEYKFRLTLKDKGQTPYSIDKPEEFLSKKAIERRQKQNLSINESDLPISEKYVTEIENLGGIVVAKSKWLNSITVHCSDSLMVDQLNALPFVSNSLFVWRGKPSIKQEVKQDTVIHYPNKQKVLFGTYYGKGTENAKVEGADYLHDRGFKGKGIEIAVIDAGFSNLPYIELLDNVNLKGAKSFIYGKEDLYANANQHGLNVLSCIAANKPYIFVGTAPEADFWILASEDSRSEYPVEEDYWATAVEYADSVGVDVVNTSLGYSRFDAPAKSFKHADLDGKTTFITRAANKAVQKGMFVVCSAGNSGDSEWRKITPPSDAEFVLTVGAIKSDSTMARFSSQGHTADLRIKPDVVALGSQATVVDEKGLLIFKSGTSFSSPIMCGIVACLWQANPELTNRELLRVIRESSNKYESPNEYYGYGIPNMEKAMLLAKEIVDKKNNKQKK